MGIFKDNTLKSVPMWKRRVEKGRGCHGVKVKNEQRIREKPYMGKNNKPMQAVSRRLYISPNSSASPGPANSQQKGTLGLGLSFSS